MIESLRDLRSFVAAAETGSMSRAARRLTYSQPAISLHIAALERQVGATLFDRGPQGLSLTMEGRAILTLARDILRLCETSTERCQRSRVDGVVVLVDPGPRPAAADAATKDAMNDATKDAMNDATKDASHNVGQGVAIA